MEAVGGTIEGGQDGKTEILADEGVRSGLPLRREVVMGIGRAVFGLAPFVAAAVLFPVTLCAQTRIEPKLVGQWEAQVSGSPLKVLLRVQSSGTCNLDDESGTCQAQGGILIHRSSDGEQSRYAYRFQGDQLVVSGGDLVEPLIFRRLGAPRTIERPGKPDVRTPQSPTGRSRAPGFMHEGWGVGFDVPPSWKVTDRTSLLLMGSDAEPGLIVIRLVRGTNKTALLSDYGEGLTEEGLRLMPSSPASEFAAGPYQGVSGELAGLAADRSQIKARIVAVMSPFGDAAVVLGMTTAEKYAQLKPRVDAIAASVSFVKPRSQPVNMAVAGQYYFFYSSSVGSYSREDTLNLCANGMFNRGGEMSASQAGEWGSASQSGAAGKWSAEGNDYQGLITLSYSNGRSAQVSYQRSGSDMLFDGRKYARFGDGSCSKRSPF